MRKSNLLVEWLVISWPPGGFSARDSFRQADFRPGPTRVTWLSGCQSIECQSLCPIHFLFCCDQI